MRRSILVALFFWVACVGLSACASAVYKSHYQYEPPGAERGRVCVSQCQKEAGQCRAKHGANQPKQCATQANRGKDTLTPEEVMMCSTSSPNSTCNQDYRICYQLCGGKVAKSQQCVANCPTTV